MPSIKLVGPTEVTIHGVSVLILCVSRGKWIASYTGSDGQLVRAVRPSRAGVLKAIVETMALRRKTFGVSF